MYTIYFIASQAAQIYISQPMRRENSNALIHIIDTPRIPGPYKTDSTLKTISSILIFFTIPISMIALILLSPKYRKYGSSGKFVGKNAFKFI